MNEFPSKTSLILLLLLFSSKNFVLNSNGTSPTNVADANNERPTLIHVLAFVPVTDDGQVGTHLHPKWTDGEAILPSAYLAQNEISNLSNFLNGYQLEVLPVRIPLCDLNEGIFHFVKEVVLNENNIVGVVGYFCHNIAKHISELLQHKELNLIQISATFDSLFELDETFGGVSHHQHVILPFSQSIARAVVKMLLRLNWSRVAVITTQKFSNYVDQQQSFLELAEEFSINVSLTMEISDISYRSESVPKEFLRELQNFGVKIIIAFLSPSEAVDILCSAYLNGFTWPNYAWIFTEVITTEILTQSKFCTKNTSLFAIDNTIFFSHQARTPTDNDTLPSGLNYSVYYDAYLQKLYQLSEQLAYDLQSNPYANVLYDSVWALALTLNRSLSILNERNLSLANISQARGEIFDVMDEQLSELSFHGATGFLNFSHDRAAVHSTVHILHYQNNQQMVIGSYNIELDTLILNITSLGDIPSDTLERVFILYPTWLMAILLVLIVACFILTTVLMFLFFRYRKKPAIKATSNTLSLCMFVGCYLLLTSSLFHTITSSMIRKESLRAFNCMLDIYLIAIGLDTVLATVIAKTIRIYHIFHKFGKVSRIFSDPGLFVIILMIVFGRIILLVIWTCLDISSVVDVEEFISQSVPPYYQVSEQCYARHLGIWLGLHFGYSAILMLIMVLLAILTRNIKREYFKDSKKINTLVMALVFDLWIFMPMWLILRLVGAIIPSRLAYCFGALIASLLCQVFLIMPKVLPLMLQKCTCFNTSRAGFYNMLPFRHRRRRQSQLISKN